MRLKLGHPDYPQYTHYITSFTPEIERQINRLGPFDIISSAYDWPPATYPYRGWTDTVNSLWWPRHGNQFSSCIMLIDDARADLVEACVSAQFNATPSDQAPRPYLILQAMLSPAEEGRPAERYEPAGILADAVTDELELIAWKLYPLPPVRLTEVDGGDDFPGLWLLPLVDIRYFWRLTPLLDTVGGSSNYAANDDFPLLHINYRESPLWMPPLRAYPDDLVGPMHYTPIVGNGTHPGINADNSRGPASDKQAGMENWRIVCRDVRSNFNAPEGFPQHTDFTGIVSDYPDDPDLNLATDSSYHEDARRLGAFTGNLIAGGNSDQAIVRHLIADKMNVLFRVSGDDYFYTIVIQREALDPTTVANLSEDEDGLGIAERLHIPKAVLGVEAGTRQPSGDHRDDLLEAAKQWVLLYYLWRRKQCFLKLPGIAPIIPNGYAATIRWDFAANKFETTYVAVEGVDGTDDGFAAIRQPRWGRIDGEGAIEDGLDGYYAWTELEDNGNGGFQVKENGIVATVENVNGETITNNPARDDSDKRACPVGLRIWVRPNTPYIDGATGLIFDHWRFTTTDLMQIVKIVQTGETNSLGHQGAIVRRWNPEAGAFVDSEQIWLIVLDS